MRWWTALSVGLLATLASAQQVSITYVGNEGVLISQGEKKVVIDALYREAMEPYINHSSEGRAALEGATGEFSGVDLVLATHRHPDHFDGGAVANHLKNNPTARFVAAEEVADRALAAGAEPTRVISANQKGPRSVRHAGIEVELAPLFHDRDPSADAPAKWAPQNLGFIVKLGKMRILHVGDAGSTPENFESMCPTCSGVDVALLPYWYLMSDEKTRVITSILKPKQIILIHVPPSEADIVRDLAKTIGATSAFITPGQKVTVGPPSPKPGDQRSAASD